MSKTHDTAYEAANNVWAELESLLYAAGSGACFSTDGDVNELAGWSSKEFLGWFLETARLTLRGRGSWLPLLSLGRFMLWSMCAENVKNSVKWCGLTYTIFIMIDTMFVRIDFCVVS